MIKLTLSAIALITCGALLLAGCSKKEQAKAPPSPKNATATSLPVYKNDKGQIVCPVTGDVIKSIKDAAGYQDFQGKRYYFCCTMCPPKFKANPEKYAIRHETEPM